MLEISPFKGIFFNEKKAGRISELIAPPYDVIEDKKKWNSLSPYNITHITLSQRGNDYIERGEKWKKWKKERIVTKEDSSSYYLCYHHFFYEGKEFTRKGFFGAVKLSEYEKREIMPHEETLASPKEDRYKLLKTTKSSLEPIFFLLPGGEEIMRILEKNKEERIFSVSFDNNRYILWRISNRDAIEKISSLISSKKLYIADGHHRYETSLIYKKENPSFTHVLGYIVPMEDRGVVILPAHRVLKSIPENSIDKLLTKGKKWFNILPLDSFSFYETLEKEGEKHHAFIFLNKEGRYPYLLKSINEKKVEKEILEHSPAWKRLDVSVLHSLILHEIMGMEEKELEERGLLFYMVDREKAIELINRGEFEGGFFLNPTKIEEIKIVADRGEKMPGKATYFYPKVHSGLIIYEP